MNKKSKISSKKAAVVISSNRRTNSAEKIIGKSIGSNVKCQTTPPAEFDGPGRPPKQPRGK